MRGPHLPYSCRCIRIREKLHKSLMKIMLLYANENTSALWVEMIWNWRIHLILYTSIVFLPVVRPYRLAMSQVLSASNGIFMFPNPPCFLGVLTQARWLKWESVDAATTSHPILRNSSTLQWHWIFFRCVCRLKKLIQNGNQTLEVSGSIKSLNTQYFINWLLYLG